MTLFLALALAAQATGSLDEHTLAAVSARPPAGARLPADLVFARADGGRTSLGDVAGDAPLVLVFADYTCRNVCTPGLALTAAALTRTGLRAGRDYRLAVIGLDPTDDAAAARRMAARVGLPPAFAGTLLLGDQAATPRLARALGYHYAYDAGADQYAHDASLYVFARRGTLSAVLPELGLQPAALKAAIGGAAPPASLAESVAHLCYGIAAAHGRFGGAVVAALQALALLLLTGMAGWFWCRGRAAEPRA